MSKPKIVITLFQDEYLKDVEFTPALSTDGRAQVTIAFSNGMHITVPDEICHGFHRAFISAFNDACELERLERESREAAAYAEGRAA